MAMMQSSLIAILFFSIGVFSIEPGQQNALCAMAAGATGFVPYWRCPVPVGVDPCTSWMGVYCNGSDVVALSTAPQVIPVLPSQIGKLTALKTLILTNSGVTQIPTQIGLLSSLEELHFDNNPLKLKKIPSEIGQLSRLSILRINRCGITDPLPNTFRNLNNLKVLEMESNLFSGTFPNEA